MLVVKHQLRKMLPLKIFFYISSTFFMKVFKRTTVKAFVLKFLHMMEICELLAYLIPVLYACGRSIIMFKDIQCLSYLLFCI